MSNKPKLVAKRGISARQKQLHTFTIQHESDVDERTYYGSFTCKKLSIADLAALGVRKAQLNGGMHHNPSIPGTGVDIETDQINAMIAHLDIALVDTPDWWDLEEICDGELLSKVFEEVVKHENSFLDRLRRRNGDAGSPDTEQGNSESDLQESGTRGVVGALVDQEVQDSLEP